MSTHAHDVGAYLLGELDADARAAFERVLASDAELRAEVERLRPVVARLDALEVDAWEGVEAPPLRLPPDALADAVATSEPAAPAPAEPAPAARPARRRRGLRGPLVLRPAFAALAAAALLAGGIAIGVLVDGGDGGTTATVTQVQQRTLPLDPLDGSPGAHGRALVSDVGAAGEPQRVTLRLRGLPESRPGQFYEVWLMDADGPLIAIGSFRVGADGRATVELPLPVPATDYQYFDISVQPEGDDANHSGESVLRGATSA